MARGATQFDAARRDHGLDLRRGTPVAVDGRSARVSSYDGQFVYVRFTDEKWNQPTPVNPSLLELASNGD